MRSVHLQQSVFILRHVFAGKSGETLSSSQVVCHADEGGISDCHFRNFLERRCLLRRHDERE